MLKLEFALPNEWLEQAQTKDSIRAELGKIGDGVELQEGVGFRGPDPTVIVAVVSATGAVMGMVIAGILGIAQKTSAQTITLRAPSGAEITFPANTPTEEIGSLIDQLKSLDDEEFRVEMKSD